MWGSVASRISWTKFFWERYWAKTRHFTHAAQHGIYLNLLGANMMRGPLDTDESVLRKLACATSEEWEAHGEKIIAEHFKIHRTKLVNQTAMEIRHQALLMLKGENIDRSAAAKKAIKARWDRVKEAEMFDSTIVLDSDLLTRMDEQEPSPLNDHVNGHTDGHTNGHGVEEEGSGWDSVDDPIDVSIDPVKIAISLYNEMAERAGLPKTMMATGARIKKLKARLKECGGLTGWKAALEKVEHTPGLCGRNERKWRANIDFLLQSSSFTKLMEGYYDNWKANGGKWNGSSDDDNAAVLEGLKSRRLEAGIRSSG